MFNSLITKILLSIARHIITAGAGALVSAGYLESTQKNDFIGSALFLAGVVLSIADKVISHQKLATMTAIAASSAGPAIAADQVAAQQGVGK